MPDHQNPFNRSAGIPKAPTELKSAGRPEIRTNWNDIKWTKNKLVGTTIALGLPYLLGIILTWKAGMAVISYILIAVAMLAGFVFLAIGWIDSDEF